MVWALVEPGLVRDVSLVAAVIGGVSTVLFNGNPLLRFDAYYMLCDAFDLPNLATRSTAFWRYLLLGRVLGLADVPSPSPAGASGRGCCSTRRRRGCTGSGCRWPSSAGWAAGRWCWACWPGWRCSARCW
jgi:hypothetical protein